MVQQCWYWFLAMVLEVFSIDKIFLLSSYVALCSVGISSIPEHDFWCHFIFLITNSFPWLTQTFFVPYLLVYNFSIGFVLESSGCLEYRFFLPYEPLHFIPILNHLSFLIPSELFFFSCYSFRFLSIVWFLLLSSFLFTLLLQLLCSFFFSIVCLLSILMFLLSSIMSTWSFLDKISALVFVFSRNTWDFCGKSKLWTFQ